MKNQNLLNGVAHADKYTAVIYYNEWCGMCGFEDSNGDTLKAWSMDEITQRKLNAWLKRFFDCHCNNVQVFDGRNTKQRRLDEYATMLNYTHR